MSSKPPDELDAVRLIAEALQPFDPKIQERIIRWAREKIDLPIAVEEPRGQTYTAPSIPSGPDMVAANTNVKSFVETKRPQSDNQFAATIAYFYRFEAPETERKIDISKDDLVEATRKTGWERIKHPAQTLVNAHGQGYFDKANRGRYALNSVGENLVAMTLPPGESKHTKKKRSTSTKKNRSPSKKRASRKKK
jgi:hypothetical protein